jgi:hypothetical protein
MMKKNEVLEILEDGGYILINTIYRTADVYNASGIHEDNCRYDTADRIGRADGYTRENGGWSYTDRVEKAAQEVKDDSSPYGLTSCVEHIEWERDELHWDAATICAQLMHSEDVNGCLFNRTMWDAFDQLFPDFTVCRETCRECYAVASTSEGTEADAVAHAARLIRAEDETNREETEPAQEAAQNEEEENEMNENNSTNQQPDKIEQEPIYLDERVPTSNSIPGIYYLLRIETRNGIFSTNHYTVDDLQTYIQDAKHHGHKILVADRVNTETGDRVPFIPETRQEQTDRENRDHCRRIAEELEAYADGLVYECPECGEHIRIGDPAAVSTENDDGETLYRLPCGCTVDTEPEQLGLYDYLADVLDIEYRINSSDRDTVSSVRVMVAFGGPTIYIDSASQTVELYWWTDRASYPINANAAYTLDEWAQELWSCC